MIQKQFKFIYFKEVEPHAKIKTFTCHLSHSHLQIGRVEYAEHVKGFVFKAVIGNPITHFAI